MDIEGVALRLILDTGSVSIMQHGTSGSVVQITHIRPYRVTGKVHNIKGQQTVPFVVDGREFNHTFLACSLPTDAAGLLGTEFLNKAGVSVDFGCGKMSLADIAKAPRGCRVSPTRGAALTIFPERLHRDLHACLSHYVNSANTKWDILVPFYLMSHRAKPHSATGFSPFFCYMAEKLYYPAMTT